jgi:hypothetical protein
LNKKITAQYNKNLKVNEFVQSKVDVEGPFLKDFKTHLKTTKIKNLWKAQLIGDTVYFKKKNSQLKLKLIDIKNVYQISMRVNGKEISLNFKDGFTKNYALLKSTIAVKDVSLWDSILDTVIPKLYADSIMTPPEELDEELSSALGWSSWALSIVKDESKVEKEKFCNLN